MHWCGILSAHANTKAFSDAAAVAVIGAIVVVGVYRRQCGLLKWANNDLHVIHMRQIFIWTISWLSVKNHLWLKCIFAWRFIACNRLIKREFQMQQQFTMIHCLLHCTYSVQSNNNDKKYNESMNDTIEVESFRFCFIDLRNALEPLNT